MGKKGALGDTIVPYFFVSILLEFGYGEKDARWRRWGWWQQSRFNPSWIWIWGKSCFAFASSISLIFCFNPSWIWIWGKSNEKKGLGQQRTARFNPSWIWIWGKSSNTLDLSNSLFLFQSFLNLDMGKKSADFRLNSANWLVSILLEFGYGEKE